MKPKAAFLEFFAHLFISVSGNKKKEATVFSERELDIHVKFYGDRPRGTPLSWELNTRRVAKYNDFGRIERYTSETVQDRS